MSTKSASKPNVFTARPKRARMRRVKTPPPVSRRAVDDDGEAPAETSAEPDEAPAEE